MSAASPWFWISFASRVVPVEDSFLGVCVVQADDHQAALERSWELGCNPGGEAQIYLLPNDALPPEDLRNRLLGKLDMRSAGGASILGLDAQ